MSRRLLSRLPERPRLDFSLLLFALTGLGIALLVPEGPRGTPARPGSYAIAISTGDELRLATRGGGTADSAMQDLGTATAPPPAQRVLACSNVMSLGALDIGARCSSGRGRTAAALPSDAARLARGN